MLTLTYNRNDWGSSYPGAYGVPYQIVTLEIDADGGVTRTVRDVTGSMQDGGNRYAYVVRDKSAAEPTEAQRALIAQWYLSKPDSREFSLSQSVCEWAFAGLTPDKVSETYGDGRRVILAGPAHT